VLETIAVSTSSHHVTNIPSPFDTQLEDRQPLRQPIRETARIGNRVQRAKRENEILKSLETGRSIVAPLGNHSTVYRSVKRTLDIVGGLAILLLLAPIMLTVFLVLLITTRGRPLFAQQRVGYCGRTFTLWKFRTMRLDAGKYQHLVTNEKDGPIFKNRRDPRITRLCRILRKTSIDETPQLFNVLAGRMSLVGPRPSIPAEVAQYELWQLRRLAVMPGLTCLWQVSGRSEIEFEGWVRMDIWYVQNQTTATDLHLLFKTPYNVLTCRGAY
jgi:lipopolysaccharide/colanic/teichoic acid biosynthesis glycosyltransferase